MDTPEQRQKEQDIATKVLSEIQREGRYDAIRNKIVAEISAGRAFAELEKEMRGNEPALFGTLSPEDAHDPTMVKLEVKNKNKETFHPRAEELVREAMPAIVKLMMEMITNEVKRRVEAHLGVVRKADAVKVEQASEMQEPHPVIGQVGPEPEILDLTQPEIGDKEPEISVEKPQLVVKQEEPETRKEQGADAQDKTSQALAIKQEIEELEPEIGQVKPENGHKDPEIGNQKPELAIGLQALAIDRKEPEISPDLVIVHQKLGRSRKKSETGHHKERVIKMERIIKEEVVEPSVAGSVAGSVSTAQPNEGAVMVKQEDIKQEVQEQ